MVTKSDPAEGKVVVMTDAGRRIRHKGNVLYVCCVEAFCRRVRTSPHLNAHYRQAEDKEKKQRLTEHHH